MSADLHKLHSIRTELRTAVELLKSGFGSLQEINFESDSYHRPHQLLASGFERLMKCYIALVYQTRNGRYPDQKFMKGLGHDLKKLLDEICAHYYGGKSGPRVNAEFVFLTTDSTAKECIQILSLFGKKGRYYNLDVISDAPDISVNPTQEWMDLESRVEDPALYQVGTDSLGDDYYPQVHSKMISVMERIARAIAWQFTLGGHSPNTDSLLRVLSGDVAYFTRISDDALGSTDYRTFAQPAGY